MYVDMRREKLIGQCDESIEGHCKTERRTLCLFSVVGLTNENDKINVREGAPTAK